MIFVLSIILLILCPVFSIPVALIGVYQGDKRAFPVLALALVFVSAFYMPFGDQYRYYQDFKEISSWTTEIFLEDGAYRKMSIPTLIMWLVDEAGGNFEHVRMICVLLGYTLGLYTINKSLPQDDDLSNRFYFTAFLTLFISLPFLPICQGYRQGVGACLALLSIHYWSMSACWWRWMVLMLLAVLCHPFYLIFIVVLPASRSNITKGKLLMACLIAFFGVYLIDALYSVVAPYLSGQLTQLSAYFDQDGEWRDVGDKFSALHRIGEQLNRIIFVTFSFFHAHIYFSSVNMGADWERAETPKQKSSRTFARVVLVLMIFWCLTVPFSSLNYRMQYVMIMLTAFSCIRLMMAYKDLRGSLFPVFVLTSMLMLYFSIGYKDLFKHLDYRALMGFSSIQMLNYTYSESYVENMLDFTGAFYDQ